MTERSRYSVGVPMKCPKCGARSLHIDQIERRQLLLSGIFLPPLPSTCTNDGTDLVPVHGERTHGER